MKYKPSTKTELQELVKDESVYLGDIDTSLITDMSNLFDRSNVYRRDFSGIESWDVSNVTDMSYMFCLETRVSAKIFFGNRLGFMKFTLKNNRNTSTYF